MDGVNWQRRRDILICIIALGVIVSTVWTLVGQFFDAILLLLLSMAIAFLITPVVNFLEKRKIPRLLGTFLVYIVIAGVLVGFVYALIFSMVNQVANFSTTVVTFVNTIPERGSNFINFLEKQANIPNESVDNALTQLRDQVTSFVTTLPTSALSVLTFLTNTFLNFFLLAVLSFYLTVDGKRIRNSIISVVPKRSLSNVLLFEDALNRVVGNYIRGQLTLALFVGMAAALICAITGLGQFALIFGVLAFLFETIPMVGPGLASISPILASLLLPDPFPRTIFVVAGFVLLQIGESNILGPRIVGHAVGLHPVASIMSLLVFAHLFGTAFGAFGGAMGALIATPIVAAVWVVIVSIYRSAHGETADQIMARKRAPWTLKRPSLPSSMKMRKPGNPAPATEESQKAAKLAYSKMRRSGTKASTTSSTQEPVQTQLMTTTAVEDEEVDQEAHRHEVQTVPSEEKLK